MVLRRRAEGHFREKQEENEKRELLFSLKGKDNVTVDGTSIEVYANIGSDDNIAAVLLNDAGGIGLFRSEFLYLESDDFPDEEKQFNVYRKVLENMAGKKVIIRTLDIGADKQADYFNLDKEENPALGFRAIRICLTHPEIFKTQLRALYRASVYGKLGIMFPMVISVEEVEKIKEMCDDDIVILTGDFNVDQHSDSYKLLHNSNLLNDSHEVADIRYAPNGTFNDFNPTLFTESRIDHIFVTAPVKVKSYSVLTDTYRVPVAENNKNLKTGNFPKEVSLKQYEIRVPSDHYPVKVLIDIAKNNKKKAH